MERTGLPCTDHQGEGDHERGTAENGKGICARGAGIGGLRKVGDKR